MNTRLDLNGKWRMSYFDTQRGGRPEHGWDVVVPGEVHDSLVTLGLLDEPTTELNCLKARWVEETLWDFRRSFNAPALAPGQRAWLCFGGLDLAATITVNGQEVGRHANAFYPCRVDVTSALLAGENSVVVRLESGLFSASDKPTASFETGNNLQGVSKRQWLRTTASSHGWDWSPRLLNVGIHGDVALEIAETVRWESLVVLATLDADQQTGHLTARVFAEGLTDNEIEGTLTIAVEETGQEASVAVTIKPGEQRLEAHLSVKQPELWWPAGHGAQARYTVTATLSVADETIGQDTKRVGFRQVRINQDIHPVAGRNFIVEVNGKPIFCKGGNFVPADILFARIDRQRYVTLIERALEAHCNFMRVWGGGLYEGDDFYEQCDEHGILVWQEFIFACTRYPGHDEAFYTDVKREATYQIRRLAHHPSLIVWCGNNEMEWGVWSWNWKQGAIMPDHGIFHHLLPLLVQDEDTTRYYQPSSPFSPDLIEPNDFERGDQHPWVIGFGETDFRKYREVSCRFADEGGILGPNALPTVLACLPEHMRTPHSFAWLVHDNSVASWGGDVPFPDTMLETWLGKRVPEMRIEEYVYWGGVVQGAGLVEYIKNFRRRMFDNAAAVFWMYNDCWPTVRSWTIVDYYLRRTPCFWPVRRAFAPVIVVVTREEETVSIYGVNEGETRQAQLRYGLLALAGDYPSDTTIEVNLPANASTLLAEFPAAQWDALGVESHVAFALLLDGTREISRDCLLLPLFKEMRWPAAEVRVTRRDGKAIFASDTFAWRVCLDLDGETALPDNFFDLYPGIPTVLDWAEDWAEPKIFQIGNSCREG